MWWVSDARTEEPENTYRLVLPINANDHEPVPTTEVVSGDEVRDVTAVFDVLQTFVVQFVEQAVDKLSLHGSVGVYTFVLV